MRDSLLWHCEAFLHDLSPKSNIYTLTQPRYRQATLIVHPDKIASCTEEQKVIAKKVFESLSESYEVFKNEPQ